MNTDYEEKWAVACLGILAIAIKLKVPYYVTDQHLHLMKKILVSLLILSIIPSCHSDHQEKIPERAMKLETIRIFGQQRPDGEFGEFDMPIEKGLEHLKVATQDEVNLEDDDLVLGLTTDHFPLAIPINALSGFEVANLTLNDTPYLLTWCPLVGTARAFDGTLNGDTSGFDFGMGLVNNNLLIIDRKTKTVWNQLSCKAIEGDLEGQELTALPTIQGTWSTWRELYPESKVAINTDTSNAVFPSSVNEKQYYHNWMPGKPRSAINSDTHNIQNLGLGVNLAEGAVFFPLSHLLELDSPLTYPTEAQDLMIHFDSVGHSAWAETKDGSLVPGVMVYEWAWKSFYPESNTFGR